MRDQLASHILQPGGAGCFARSVPDTGLQIYPSQEASERDLAFR